MEKLIEYIKPVAKRLELLHRTVSDHINSDIIIPITNVIQTLNK